MKSKLFSIAAFSLVVGCTAGSDRPLVVDEVPTQKLPEENKGKENSEVKSDDAAVARVTAIVSYDYASIPPCTRSDELTIQRSGPSYRKFVGMDGKAMSEGRNDCIKEVKENDLKVSESEFNQMVKILMSVKLTCPERESAGGVRSITLKQGSEVVRSFNPDTCLGTISGEEKAAIEKVNTWIAEQQKKLIGQN